MILQRTPARLKSFILIIHDVEDCDPKRHDAGKAECRKALLLHRALRLESNQHSILPISVFFIPPSSKHYPKTSAPRKLISERGFQKTAWIGPELGPTCERGSVGARAKTLKQPRLRVAPHRTEEPTKG